MASATDPDCLFCKIVAGKLPADHAYEDDTILAFKDIHPQAPFLDLLGPSVQQLAAGLQAASVALR